MIAGIVALYRPKTSDLVNIKKYVDSLDLCILMDDTGVDNRDLFVSLLEKGSDNVVYFANEKNIGLCASVNRGFRYAVERGAEWILVMNPDGTFQNDAINIYRRFISNHDCANVAIIAPQYNYDRHPRKIQAGYRQIFYADMSGSFYNAAILSKMEYYNPDMYFDGLDMEYCLRVQKAGYKMIQCKEAVLNHHPACTKELRIGQLVIFRYGKDTPLRYYYQFRCFFYLQKVYHNWRVALFFLYKYMKVLILFDHKKEYLREIKKAKRDYKQNYFGAYK